MRLARKLFLLAVMALAALAMTASTASAQIEILDEETDEHCSEVTILEHHVEGGCHIEFQSTGEVPLLANIPGVGVVSISNCEVHIEARVGENGEGWVTQALLTGHPAPSFPCVRTPCDEPGPSHAELPWEIHHRESAGQESIEARFCLRPSTGSEGVGNTFCTVHFELTDLGGHLYEIGHPNVESHCEPGDFPFDVWIANAHFLNEGDPVTSLEDVEIIH